MTGDQELDTQELDTDLCVIGAGPAGINVARELAGTGIRTCLVESGGREFERRIQRQSRGESDGYSIHRLDRSRVRAFGGTLRHPRLGDEGWAARPLDPIDFESRPGIPHSGWPIDREHLEPYYARAQRASGLGAYDYEADTWSDRTRTPTFAVDGPDVETTVFQFGHSTFDEAYDQLVGSPNVEVLLNSRVVGLFSHPRERHVERVVVRRDDGSRLVLRPRVVVLATGGIENARLLLTADDMRGLGNDHDLVGRFFAERLSLHAGHIIAARPDLVGAADFYDIHDVRDASLRGALRVADKVQRDRQLLNCAFFVFPRPAQVTTAGVRSLATLRKAVLRRPLLAETGRHTRNIATGLRDVAGLALSRVRPTQPVLVVRAQAEQAPNRESRVTLGSRRDDLGLPVAKVTWRVDDSDRASVADSLEVLDGALRVSGLGRVESALGEGHLPALLEGNHHHMGTTRMHADPQLGVVDADCLVHGVSNLYVTGSSVFPTFGASNPTLTIVALALRLADHLRRRLGA